MPKLQTTGCVQIRRSFFAAVCCVLACSILTLASPLYAEDIPINLDNDQARLAVKSIVITTGGEGELKTSRLQELNRLARRVRNRYSANISVDELHQIADALTLAVREEGYNFDSLYLPPQTVSKGVVQFRYQKTILASVNVINNTEFKDSRLSRPFRHLLGKRLYAPRIENIVYALQAQPSLSVFAFYSRGKRNDEVVLNLRVDARVQPGYSLRIENYGSEATGKHRLVGELKGRNVLTDFDQATLAVLGTHGDGNTAYAYFNYRYQLSSMNTAVNFGAGDTRYALGSALQQLEASGASRTVRLDVSRVLSHNPADKSEFGGGAFFKTSEFSSEDPLFNEALGRNEQSMGASVNFNSQSSGKRWTLSYGATFIGGQFSLSEEAEKEALLKAEYYLFSSLMLNGNSRFALQPRLFIRGQQTPREPMPSIETMSLSGFYGVRSTPLGLASADSGMLMSAEVHLPKLVSRQWAQRPFVLAPYAFYDSGSGEQYQADSDPLSVDQSGFGVGLSARWGRLALNLAYATAAKSDTQEGEGDDQVYFQLRWQ